MTGTQLWTLSKGVPGSPKKHKNITGQTRRKIDPLTEHPIPTASGDNWKMCLSPTGALSTSTPDTTLQAIQTTPTLTDLVTAMVTEARNSRINLAVPLGILTTDEVHPIIAIATLKPKRCSSSMARKPASHSSSNGSTNSSEPMMMRRYFEFSHSV